jgi:hypothetical protein
LAAVTGLAATGCYLGYSASEPAYLPTELAEFTVLEIGGKVFTQIQWEQKFARSVISARAKSKPQPATGGNGNAGIQPVNTASRAVQEIQAARERWEKQRTCWRRIRHGGYGRSWGNIFEPVDPEERGGTSDMWIAQIGSMSDAQITLVCRQCMERCAAGNTWPPDLAEFVALVSASGANPFNLTSEAVMAEYKRWSNESYRYSGSDKYPWKQDAVSHLH